MCIDTSHMGSADHGMSCNSGIPPKSSQFLVEGMLYCCPELQMFLFIDRSVSA